ncbi:ArdC family protein [Azospirillum humicireducens]|uniref:ArdC family protein n=1 Tax=Azospirillum humicireducens TaxID=1226968 RepID=UPI0007C0FC07|nr:zincin-like metallopeptidase domain-containing protein [Azospirillum humicireducens]
MPHALRDAQPASGRVSLYAEITARIIAELEAGRLPWVQPWGSADTASLGLPRNASSGRAYSGINVLILWGAVFAGGFSGQNWLTYRQARSLGGTVRRGERGTTLVYADRFVPDRERLRAREEGETAQPIPFLKRFTVFNTDQCEGLPENIAPMPPPIPAGLILPRAEALIRASGVEVRIGGDRAFYHLQHDYVQVPAPQSFFEPVNWHRTALHELGHSTGHPSRLGRDLSGAFGSRKYAFEELVAEIASAFLCAALGIVPTVRHADYIGTWLEVLREDDRAIVRAASQASRAADYLLACLPEGTMPGREEEGGGDRGDG